MGILNNYRKPKMRLFLTGDVYQDFFISQDKSKTVELDGNLTTKCLSAFIDTEEDDCIEENGLVSMNGYSYEDGYCSGVTLNDIGLTGIDNGLVLYDKYTISNKDFYKILTESTHTIEDGDMRFHVRPVSGNTCVYNYPFEMVESGSTRYAALSGGFYQGFFKLHGFDYEVLPSKLYDTWHVEIVLRPMDYEEEGCTLNKIHPDNKGIFFYMGTRAENKFAQFYDTDFSGYEDREYCAPLDEICDNFYKGAFAGYDPEGHKEYLDGCDYFTNRDILPFRDYALAIEPNNEGECCGCGGHIVKIDTDQEPCGCCSCENYFIVEETESENPCDKIGYFAEDEYLVKEDKCTDKCHKDNFFADDDYIEPEMSLDDIAIMTSDDYDSSKNGFYEIETDNKYLLFHHGNGGFNVNNWDDDYRVVLTGRSVDLKENPYLVYHHGKGGFNVDTIGGLYEQKNNAYDIRKDFENNSFALIANEDGSIGYRYMVKDCDSENGYSVLEERSYPNLLEEGSWAVINAKFQLLGNTDSDEKCPSHNSNLKMKVWIYVNGYLKFVSQELPAFDFKALDEISTKQEGVPYNISIGGGTQGLCDSVWTHYFYPFEKVLPIEENFGGTFIGDIKAFRFYTCELEYNEIKNNYLYETAVF